LHLALGRIEVFDVMIERSDDLIATFLQTRATQWPAAKAARN